MERFDLDVYKDSKQYFILFDILLKELDINKEAFLIDNNITPSSYRKCRKGELTMGPKIIEQLANHFSYKIPTDDFIDELKKFLDKIYYDMYYKIYTTYDEDLKKLDNLIEENYLIYPILKLFKTFMQICSNKKLINVRNENIDLYYELKKYEHFFNDSLYDIYELIYLTLEDNISEGRWIKNYNNALAYFLLATRSYMRKSYIESLFFATKSKDILVDDGNIIRVLYINNTIMSSLLYVENYEECYVTSSKQLLILESIGQTSGFLVKTASKYLVASLLGLKRYDKIIDYLGKNEGFNLTELTCLLVAKFKTNEDEYNDYFGKLPIESFEQQDQDYLKLLDTYLHRHDKRLLAKLESYEVLDYIIKIIKVS